MILYISSPRLWEILYGSVRYWPLTEESLSQKTNSKDELVFLQTHSKEQSVLKNKLSDSLIPLFTQDQLQHGEEISRSVCSHMGKKHQNNMAQLMWSEKVFRMKKWFETVSLQLCQGLQRQSFLSGESETIEMEMTPERENVLMVCCSCTLLLL